MELATLAFTISLETVSASGSASADVTTSNPRRTLFASGLTALAVALNGAQSEKAPFRTTVAGQESERRKGTALFRRSFPTRRATCWRHAVEGINPTTASTTEQLHVGPCDSDCAAINQSEPTSTTCVRNVTLLLLQLIAQQRVQVHLLDEPVKLNVGRRAGVSSRQHPLHQALQAVRLALHHSRCRHQAGCRIIVTR